MIKSIKITNYVNESIVLDLSAPEKSGFVVAGIEGLGPVKSTINMADLATLDGSVYESARAEKRNIVLSLVFTDTQLTIEEVRHLSYKFFPIKKKLTLTVTTDQRTATTTGYVESNEPVIFHNMSNTSISILCPDPYFYSDSDGTNIIEFCGIEDELEFPFSTEIGTDEQSFGEISNSNTKTINYIGDAETGVTITIKALGTVEGLKIYNTTTRETMTLNKVLYTGDEVTLCTIKGSKSIVLLRDGVYTNLLNDLGRYPDWFELQKGDNEFAYTADVGGSDLQFKIEHQVLYEGI